MLAVMQHLRNNRAVRLTALAPKHGPLAEQLRNAQIKELAEFLKNHDAGAPGMWDWVCGDTNFATCAADRWTQDAESHSCCRLQQCRDALS